MKYFKSLVAVVILLPMLQAGQAVAAGSSAHGGDIIYTKPLQSVTFSHKSHVEDMGLSCDLCHSGLFEMQALKVQGKTNFTMAALAKGEYCGACHNGTMAFASTTRCASCHSGVKGGRLAQNHE
jgi:c(7)-type cytochrome triheme protein